MKEREEWLCLGFTLAMAISVMIFASAVSMAAQLPSPPNGTPPTIYITADPSEIPADGCSTSTITVSVWDGEYLIFSGPVVNFSTDLGEITASAPIENGTATATFTAGTTEGVATIRAEVNLGEDIGILHNTTTVNLTAPGATPTASPGNGGGTGDGGDGGNGGDGGTTTPTPTPTLTPTPTGTASPAPTVTATVTPTPRASPGETETPTATESPTPSPSPGPTKKPLIPGFEALFAIASLLAVAYLVLRKGRRE